MERATANSSKQASKQADNLPRYKHTRHHHHTEIRADTNHTPAVYSSSYGSKRPVGPPRRASDRGDSLGAMHANQISVVELERLTRVTKYVTSSNEHT